MTFSAKVDTRRLRIAMRRAPGRLAEAMSVAFDQHGFIFEGHARARLLRGDPGVTGRTGKLARSIGHTKPRRAQRIADVRMRVFIGGGVARYARIQEFGGVVRPTRSRYLTIPLPDNLTAGGVPRYKSARDLFERRPGDVFIARTKRGKLLIGLREGQGKNNVKWLWTLKESVRLKPRLGFRKLFRSPEMQADRERRFNVAVRRALKGGK